ncbi:MAG: hypothetical protein LBR06_02745 [Bacteroidales bacterium]|jgi:hypothetical protein|nr:hypothetical protein [Bacteroidales bacterium]
MVHVSIFLENKMGHFGRVTRVLRDSGINIRAISLTHTANGWGVLHLLVDNPEQAQTALKNAGLSAALRRIFVFEMEDRPGGLDELLLKIGQAGVNIINAYGQLARGDNAQAYLIADVDDYDAALPLIKAQGLNPVEDNIIYKN